MEGEELGRFVTNIPDIRGKTDEEASEALLSCQSLAAVRALFDSCVVGPPSPVEGRSTKQLQEAGLVGLYRKPTDT